VLPSYYREGVPRSLLEAASLEIPIITTNNVGCREVVEDGYNGFLCSIKDSENLAEKMERVIKMEKSCLKQMGCNGREKVIAEFHEKLVLKYYEEILNTL
jgi:glycosyltransferase involved in cell wall biosynthesis